jgi:hypothetical protein
LLRWPQDATADADEVFAGDDGDDGDDGDNGDDDATDGNYENLERESKKRFGANVIKLFRVPCT